MNQRGIRPKKGDEIGMNNSRRSWAEIDLEALAENYCHIRKRLNPETILLAVVKADGYGHGALQVAQTALRNGAGYLATATLDEALALRRQAITAPILVLGYVDPQGFAEAIMESITLTLFDETTAAQLARQARQLRKVADVHIKVDTGMGRIGFPATEEAASIVCRINQYPELHVQGLFTHFALADGKNKQYTYEQFERFQRFAQMLVEKGVSIPIRHCANSAAIMELPNMQLEMVRAGIIQYGLYPSNEVDRSLLPLTPVMRFKSRVTYIKEVEAGKCISYGCTYETQGKTRIATIGVGYADGYSRLLSNRGEVVIHGKKVPIVGRVCMDQCMVDVTSLPQVRVGDEVLLFGREEDGITAEQVAEWTQTIPYETVCLLTNRVPRLYIPERNS